MQQLFLLSYKRSRPYRLKTQWVTYEMGQVFNLLHTRVQCTCLLLLLLLTGFWSSNWQILIHKYPRYANANARTDTHTCVCVCVCVCVCLCVCACVRVRASEISVPRRLSHSYFSTGLLEKDNLIWLETQERLLIRWNSLLRSHSPLLLLALALT